MISTFLNPSNYNLLTNKLKNKIYPLINCEIHSIKFTSETNDNNEINYYTYLAKGWDDPDKKLSLGSFWDQFKYSLPKLYLLMLKYNSYSATELAVERLFSMAKYAIGDHRTRMNCELFSSIVKIKFNWSRLSDNERQHIVEACSNEIKNKRAVIE